MNFNLRYHVYYLSSCVFPSQVERSTDSKEALRSLIGAGGFPISYSSRQGQKRRSVFELLDVKQGFQHLPDNPDAGIEQGNHQAISITEEGINPASGMPIQSLFRLGATL